jgi:pyruvate-formate lyase
MILSERIKKLREESLNAVEKLTAERALLITQFYKNDESRELSAPVRKAKAFEYILKNKKLYIGDGELIVGERGPAPKVTPTYPEICIHSLEDLDILDKREKVSFKVDAAVRDIYEKEIIPYWKGKSNRERIMTLMTPEWHNAYNAGVFTEFQEQRAPGHTVLGYKIFHKGFLQLKEEIKEILSKLDYFNDPEAYDKSEELKAMYIACDAIIMYAERYADKLQDLSQRENNPDRKRELKKMAEVCRRVPAHAPETVHELNKALEADFSGYEQIQHDLIYNTPKYGNDIDYADRHAADVFEIYYDAVNGRPDSRGGVHRINMLPTTSHVYFGSVTGATPDGRKAFKPLSEGISPVQGADKQGPTSVIKSASKIDHLRTGGTLLNQKFTPQFFEDEESYSCLTALIRSYFAMDGHHIQFNVVNAETLREARKHPELYRDLIVRVAGYSDYFNDLGEDLQNEIIERTEHE